MQYGEEILVGYIRERGELLTGFQESAPWTPEIDLQCDFVMVYGLDETTEQRVQAYREKGYRVHLMTGISWGKYQDYLKGHWDGRAHWQESQMDRYGNPIVHGEETPYMVPTVAFADYLTEKLKQAIHMGVEAIHVEEPEFWEHGGYSEAFRQEYLLYYRTPWQPPHKDIDTFYKAAKLKAFLYARTIERVSAALKEYALTRFDREIGFYVPTHSLLNYAQWKIISPEGRLIDIPTLDGYIAQIWTGTSRTANVYEGVSKERTFETAFLEYGIMQELTKGTGRRMWFLHDPIEDMPEYTWEDYRRNYLKTVVASLMHPLVHHFEVCPWPRRVFNGVFPRKAGLADGMIPTTDMPGAKPIPPQYATLLSSVTQMLGDMGQDDWSFDGLAGGIGVFLSDTCLYQRNLPDGVSSGVKGTQNKLEGKLRQLAKRNHAGEDTAAESKALLEGIEADKEALQAFSTAEALPGFYGLTLPLLKHGLPVRPVQLDNVRRFPGYLDDYQTLILSYEFIKPETPDIHAMLANWVRGGGTLIYVGDGSDSFHGIHSWWNQGKEAYANASEHLFEMLGLEKVPADGRYAAGKGHVAVWNMAPARISADASLAEKYRSIVKDALAEQGMVWEASNALVLRRGPYVIAYVMDEGTGEPLVLHGQYADMLESGYPIIAEKTVMPGEGAVLFDLEMVADASPRIIGTAARVFSMDVNAAGFMMEMKAADRIDVFTRVRLDKQPTAVTAVDEANVLVDLETEWDAPSQTLRLRYASQNKRIAIQGTF